MKRQEKLRIVEQILAHHFVICKVAHDMEEKLPEFKDERVFELTIEDAVKVRDLAQKVARKIVRKEEVNVVTMAREGLQQSPLKRIISKF